ADELSEYAALHATHLSRTPTGTAGLRPVRGGGTGPAAGVTPFEQLHLQSLLDPRGDFRQRDLQLEADVLPPLRLRAASPAPAEEILEAAEATEIAHEDVQRILEAESGVSS